jgi:hypothetical protein
MDRVAIGERLNAPTVLGIPPRAIGWGGISRNENNITAKAQCQEEGDVTLIRLLPLSAYLMSWELNATT